MQGEIKISCFKFMFHEYFVLRGDDVTGLIKNNNIKITIIWAVTKITLIRVFYCVFVTRRLKSD